MKKETNVMIWSFFFKKQLYCFYLASLQLDKLRSSPKEVRTYYGLPVELRCTFEYGAYPVQAVISHKGKIVARQQNGTQAITLTAGQKNDDFGVYTCQAEDANHKKITYEIQLKKIGEHLLDKARIVASLTVLLQWLHKGAKFVTECVVHCGWYEFIQTKLSLFSAFFLL